METRRNSLLTLVAMALVLALSFASVALAHGGEAHGNAERLSGVGWAYLPLLFALVGVIYYATRRRE